MKRPAFQFYPADWRKDLELGSCEWQSRGVWWEMLCVMHEARPYGHLVRDGRVLNDIAASNLCRVPLPAYRKAIADLEANGVFSRTAEGVIYSRRLVRDEALRNKRAEYGKLGGNPALLNGRDNHTEDSKVNPPDKGQPTPSSAVAFASSSASVKHAVATRGSTAGAGDSHGMGDKTHVNGKGKARESWQTLAWATDTAKTFGMPQLPGEGRDAFIDRMCTAATARLKEGAKDAKRRGH